MNKKLILALGFVACLTGVKATVAKAAAIDELDAAQKEKLVRGEAVTITEKIPHKPWPRMKIYEIVPGTPEEAAAVTYDWELKAAYTKNLKSAKVTKQVSPLAAWVEYTVSEPVIGDEHFTMENKVSVYDDGKSYKIDFHLVEGDHTREAEGSTRLEEFSGATLMAVDTFTDPHRALAGKVAGYAVKQTVEACEGFAAQMEKERNSNQALLQRQITSLRDALSTKGP